MHVTARYGAIEASMAGNYNYSGSNGNSNSISNDVYISGGYYSCTDCEISNFRME